MSWTKLSRKSAAIECITPNLLPGAEFWSALKHPNKTLIFYGTLRCGNSDDNLNAVFLSGWRLLRMWRIRRSKTARIWILVVFMSLCISHWVCYNGLNLSSLGTGAIFFTNKIWGNEYKAMRSSSWYGHSAHPVAENRNTTWHWLLHFIDSIGSSGRPYDKRLQDASITLRSFMTADTYVDSVR